MVARVGRHPETNIRVHAIISLFYKTTYPCEESRHEKQELKKPIMRAADEIPNIAVNDRNT